MATPMLMTNEVLRKTIALSERCPDAPFDAASGRELAREVLHLRAQRDDLHARNSELVEERRAAIAERDEARELACREGKAREASEADRAREHRLHDEQIEIGRAQLAAATARTEAAEKERDEARVDADRFKQGCEYRGAVLTEARAAVNEQGDYLHDADGDLARAVRMLGGDLRFNIEHRTAAETALAALRAAPPDALRARAEALACEMEECADSSLDLTTDEWAARIRSILVSHPAPASPAPETRTADPRVETMLRVTDEALARLGAPETRTGEGAKSATEKTCPVPNCHAGMLRSRDGRDSVSCPVCDGVLTPEAYRSLVALHEAPAQEVRDG